MSTPPLKFLDNVASEHTGLAAMAQKLRDLYDRKLWHELSIELQDTFRMPEVIEAGLLQPFYTQFILDFGHKLNLLRLALFARDVAKHHADPLAAITFLEEQIKSLEALKSSGLNPKEAVICLEMQAAELMIYSSNLPGCKTRMDKGLESIQDMQDVDPAVSAAVYHVRALYFKARQEFGDYYRSALQYLCYVSSEAMGAPAREALARDLALAALLAPSIYSFAELLMHPLIEALTGTQSEWLVHLLHCFSEGDMAKYEALCAQYGAEMNAQPALVAAERQLKEKVTIMCLVALVSAPPPEERKLDISAIAARTRLDCDGTEFLLMKALSLGLIKATIDEVDGTVSVTWVQPRVLMLPQIGALKGHLQNWMTKVDKASSLLEAEGITSVEAMA